MSKEDFNNDLSRIPANKLPNDYVLFSENFGGNLHSTSQAINKLGLSDYVLTMECTGCNNTVVVFRVEKTLLNKFMKGVDDDSKERV